MTTRISDSRVIPSHSFMFATGGKEGSVIWSCRGLCLQKSEGKRSCQRERGRGTQLSVDKKAFNHACSSIHGCKFGKNEDQLKYINIFLTGLASSCL